MAPIKKIKMKPTKSIVSIIIVIFLLLTSIGIVSGEDEQDDKNEDDENGDDSSTPKKDKVENAGARGKTTFLYVEEYKHWVVKVNKAKDRSGVDLVTVEYDADERTLSITAQDTNSTNNVNILINKEFVDDLITDDFNNLNFDLSEAVNYEGMSSSNDSNGKGAFYVFHIKHFSTQFIELSPYVYLNTESFIAVGIGGILIIFAAIFLFRKDKKRW
ncbi:MAG: hypothetical protein JSV49_07035 [Thermoplasmata archaeon]|nr:MAG: hypothetical protein JSV49_07035 [Thermoplasmata archaeon]